MKHNVIRIIMAAVALVTAAASYAVTDKEMEQARAIAAKHYLRYANNGSGYLDDTNPSTMADLNKVLKAKEKENIKAFNAVAVPKDYATWDKAKLVEYWSSTFFNAPGLLAKGKECKGRLKTKLNAMKVSAPSAATAPAAAEAKPADAKTPEAKDAKAAEAPKAGAEAKPAEAPKTQAPEEPKAPTADEAAAMASVDSAIAQAEADAGLADEQPRKSSHTGWYIAILAVLVGVVVWLVVYAAKTMNLQGGAADPEAGARQVREAKKEAKEQQNQMREQFANSLAAKSDELKQCKARVAQLEEELEAARMEIKRLNAERREAKAAATSQAAQTGQTGQTSQTSQTGQTGQTGQASQTAAQKPSSGAQLPPVVYLGHANSRGLFVKASRSLNPESTVYRMDIPDGRNGTFMVVNDRAAVDRILIDPEQWLAGGCVIENPDEADSAEGIVTTAAGEALFADNTCRVVKKARIRFI